jgi:uncharacterized protein (UPF0218 family)
MRVLPEGMRHAFKAPFGDLHPDIGSVIPLIGSSPVFCVGDIVTHHLLRYHVLPQIAVVDGHTMRTPCHRLPEGFPRRVTVKNPPGTITDELISALEDSVEGPQTLVIVEGEEDLAVIPLVLAAPIGAVILYGQPGEGVVLRTVDLKAKTRAQELLGSFVSVGQPPGHEGH